MTDMAVQNGAPPQDAAPVDPQQVALHRLALDVTEALLQAIKVAAQVSATATDTREMDEGGKAALNFAQAIVLLDPNLNTEGSPLGHEMALAQLQHEHAMAQGAQEGQLAIQQAKAAAAAAPTPSRSISVKRDSAGRAAGYDVKG